jgi:hypothetical protein
MFSKALIGLFFVGSMNSFGGLIWEDTSLKNDATTTQEKALLVFRFKNDGPMPVTIKSVESTCDCIAAEADIKEYAPGEKGEIKVTLWVKGRVGLQRKTVEVTTDDPNAPKTTLTLNTLITQPVQINPSVLWWKTGDEKRTQTVRITVAPGADFTIARADCADPAWHIDLKTVSPGKEYALEATPSDTAKVQATIVHLKTDKETVAAQLPDIRL